ncbi:adhesion G protein-coupled receptor L4-like [Sinocyclocheilus rhinocerous]|uniref:adhesion G protein-coupled receptor L4-like n=1 Tax=Sinocyclocheilus rhinocerous TaxID=307959 RepID=UPI0007B94EA9|nr:PREDICTED: adhesion G protein-coupled receptor L4-like [Sinocyclocheilus rhinocerous]
MSDVWGASADCADVGCEFSQSHKLLPVSNLSDPCYNYTVLDDPWRATNNTYASVRNCDRSVTWSSWYRLFINNMSAHIPDTCVAQYSCGTAAPLWIRGGHPTVEDGVVTRDVCGHWINYCCFFGSFPIKVKACPGNYYVYELVRPTFCYSAYCAAVTNISSTHTTVTPETSPAAVTNISSTHTTVTPETSPAVYSSIDPCSNYTVLDDPWRANSSRLSSSYKCDSDLTSSSWYRLFINNMSAHIPDTCVAQYSCGTAAPLWIRGGHPTVEDGVVTRDVCGHWHNYCCFFWSFPIKVKACPGNYYVYELVRPTFCYSAYCAAVTNISSTHTTVTPETSPAAVTNISSTHTTVTPETSPAGINITLPEECTSQTPGGCLQNLLEQLENITAQVLPLNTVTNILNTVFNASEKIVESSSSASPAELASYGNRVLKASEKLSSALVKPTDTNDSVSFTLAAVEGQVFMVGPQVTFDKIPRLDTTNSSVDIDLIGIARNNNGRSAAVAFMSYNTMENLLKPDFFNTSNTIKTMMSTVISATLPKTTNTKLTKPVNFTLKHIREFDPSGSLSCVYWNSDEWIVDGCSVLKTSSSYTVCSCDHLSTFALIMQTSRPPESDPLLELLNLVCVIVGLVFFSLTLLVIVGLVFFSLALLTFALCQWSPGVSNVARINICISLLLAHLLFLLTQRFLSFIRRQHVLCAVISGLLHFLFLSGFVWMFIEAIRRK